MLLYKRLTAVLEPIESVRLAVLFGSAARRTDNPGSDVDVALRLEPDDAETRHALQASLGRAVGREVDVVYLDEAPLQLRFEISRDGILLLERSEHAWSEYRARSMVEWWDWAPLARLIHSAAIRKLKEKTAHGQV